MTHRARSPRFARLRRVVPAAAAAACLAAAPPAPPVCPSDAAQRVVEAKSLIERAQKDYDRGALVDAAEAYSGAVMRFPECEAHHLRRATALEQAVATYEKLHGGSPQRLVFVEQALELVDTYLADLRTLYASDAEALEGAATATALRDRLSAELAAASPGAPDPEPPPAVAAPEPVADPAPPTGDRKLAIGVGVSAGVGALSLAASLGLMISARRQGPLWRQIYARSIYAGTPSSAEDPLCARTSRAQDEQLDALCAGRTGRLVGAAILGAVSLAAVATAAVLGARMSRASRPASKRAAALPSVDVSARGILVGGVVRF